MSFDTLLVANRGEIACRIIRTATAIGLRTVAVFSDPDRGSPHVGMADEAVHIGPAPARDSYLRAQALIDAARSTGSGAVHPGYGLLSEDAAFARATEDAGLTFVGPTPRQLELFGAKDSARRLARDAGVPLAPGSEALSGTEEALEAAQRIGYPVMLKATGGGGGIGLAPCHSSGELAEAFERVGRVAEASFGRGGVFLERYIEHGRHVEVQVFGDGEGHCLGLGDRDCTLQRRHQKVVEEAPAPNLPRKTRENLLKTAVKGARAAGYTSAGTLEFLLDSDGRFYFMEMNTRIQVEHPITEETARIDLVAWQIRVAAGERITFREEDLRPQGHSIECRITAEDASNDFAPSVGTVETYVAPGGPGVRVDSHLFGGYAIPPNYDSLLGKIIVWGKDRDEAIARMERALRETIITGVANTITFHSGIVADDAFRRGDVHTGFIPEFLDRAGHRIFEHQD